MFAVRTRSGSKASEQVPPRNWARTSASRFVIGLPARKWPITSRTSATSSMPRLDFGYQAIVIHLHA